MLAFPEMLKSSVKKSLSSSKSGMTIFEKGLDLLAIIVSIYLALSIESCAEKRSEHKRLNTYYHNLLDEIAVDTTSLHDALESAEMHILNHKKHISYLGKYNTANQDSVIRCFTTMMQSIIFHTSHMVSYNSMVLSGDIKLIEDLDVREKLIELDETYQSLKIYEDMYMDFMRNDLSRFYYDHFDMMVGEPIDPSYLGSIEYRNLVFTYYGLNLNRLEQYQSALENAVETLEMIKKET
jgi:hypothetical protein